MVLIASRRRIPSGFNRTIKKGIRYVPLQYAQVFLKQRVFIVYSRWLERAAQAVGTSVLVLKFTCPS
jgi:hypothetical protein